MTREMTDDISVVISRSNVHDRYFWLSLYWVAAIEMADDETITRISNVASENKAACSW